MENPNVVLQITDLVTTRRFAVRIDPAEAELPVGALLDRYLKAPDLERLSRERRITIDSSETLASVGDLVYACTDAGMLREMFAGVVLRQGPRQLALDERASTSPVRVGDKTALMIDLAIDRTGVGYDRNWVGFHKRRWDRQADDYSRFVRSCLEQRNGRDGSDAVLQLETPDQKTALVEALARRIWSADFESYSRFAGRKLVYKTGDETVRNIIEGAGGICSEKVQALRFLTDHYGIPSELVLAGANAREPVPEDRLRELLTTFDFRFSKRYMRYWQHTALVYDIDGESILVDATNGNIPFLFLKDDDAERVLGYDTKRAVQVKMSIVEEDFYYHRVSQDIPHDLFFAMEGWITHMDLVQVFDNELGLCITKEFMVAPIVFRDEGRFLRLRDEYAAACDGVGLQCSASRGWDLDSDLGQRFARRHPAASESVMEARDHLVARYDDCHGGGHDAGLVVIELGR